MRLAPALGLALALVLPACSRSPASRGQQGSGSAAGSGSGSAAAAVDPWAEATAPRPPDTPELRQRRAEAALGRVTTIEPAVGRLRQLTFDHPVPTRYQKPDEFRAFVRREIARELPAPRSRDLTAALAHLGFLTRADDLATALEQAMTTQAGAYYDPEAKAFFLVMVPDNDTMLDTISAHELTHALQDQHFELAKYLPSDASLDDDAATARRFVVEGDATFVMLLYTMHGILGDQITPPVLAALRGQITRLATQSLADLEAQAKAESAVFGGMDAEIKKSIDAMDDIPPAVLVPLLDSYMKGALVALTAYEHGGWDGVNALYRDPPVSTEQVLHPQAKLFAVRERPHRVTLAPGAGHQLAGNVLGELQWRIYFELWKSPRAAEASEGWGGDRFSVTVRGDGRRIGRIATIWDSPEDAAQFARAYLATLAVRFPGADLGHPEAGVARSGGGRVFVRTAGARVFIVDGADDASALDALIRTTRFD
jgi:hypothetical protein